MTICTGCQGDYVDLIGVFDVRELDEGTVCELCGRVYVLGPYTMPVDGGMGAFAGLWREATGMEKMEASIGDERL